MKFFCESNSNFFDFDFLVSFRRLVVIKCTHTDLLQSGSEEERELSQNYTTKQKKSKKRNNNNNNSMHQIQFNLHNFFVSLQI